MNYTIHFAKVSVTSFTTNPDWDQYKTKPFIWTQGMVEYNSLGSLEADGSLSGPCVTKAPGFVPSPSPIFYNADLAESDVTHVLFTQHWHDGTHLHTSNAIAAVTEYAEQFTKQETGEWVLGPVYITSQMTKRDMPYGKDRDVLHEGVMLTLKQTLPLVETKEQ